MERAWLLAYVGIIDIVIGSLTFVTSLLAFTYGLACTCNYYQAMDGPQSPLEAAGFILLPLVAIIISLLAITGGVHALKRKGFKWALAGSAAACVAIPLILAVLAVLFGLMGWWYWGLGCALLIGLVTIASTVQAKNDFTEEERHNIKLSNIYRLTTLDRVLFIGLELKDLAEVLSCPTCKFADQEARKEGKPWCNSPDPPDIDKKYCRTFEFME